MRKIEIEENLTLLECDYDYTICNEIAVEQCSDDYSNFFRNYVVKNLPCVIKNVSSDWECSQKWIHNEEINTEYFKARYGDLKAPIADCDNLCYNAHKKIEMSVQEYMDYLKSPDKSKLLYLKDWHLQRLRPEEKFYEVPLFFASDWLNEFAFDHKDDDYMFVYIGPQNSWTPLHADVYNSYSWSVNVVGRKKWIFFPPSEENKLKDQFGNLPLLFDADKYHGIKYFEIVQEKGDAIFVPSGWHHQVINLVDTVSINHNWINACNLEFVWIALKSCLNLVEKEIQEFENSPEFTSQCQIILKSLFGMDFSDFLNFILYIGQKRLLQILGETSDIVVNFELGKNHTIFDLQSILKTIKTICKHQLLLDNILSPDTKNHLKNIKMQITKVLQEIPNT